MDELIDLIDGLDAISDVGDLAEAGVDLDALTSAMDLTDCDPDAIAALASLDDLADGSAFADAAGVEGSETFVGQVATGEEIEFYVPGPEQMPRMVDDALGSYPTERLARLRDISYTHDAATPDGLPLGSWSSGGDGASIEIYGHSESAWETLHHELGHHVVENDPSLKRELLEAVHSDGFDDDQAHFLSGYPEEERASEACAEAVAKFKANAPAFALKYPRIAALLVRRVVR